MCQNFVSKRHLRRLVEKEIEKFSNSNRETLSEQEASEPNKVNELSNENSQAENFIVHYDINSINVSENFNQKLASWVIENRVSNECCNSLLYFLKGAGMDVPLCRETLLKALHAENLCCYENPEITDMPPGEYFHYGLEKALMMHGQYLSPNANAEILIDIFVDGMPHYKSSSIKKTIITLLKKFKK